MDTMPISKFKATCLSALERVRRTGRPLRVTRFAKPVADVVRAAPKSHDWLGGMKDSLEIRGDVVGPTGGLVQWDAID